ncbi:MAG: hypothetical protein VR72_01090 [Clostridiaceae bacterium BRH_c20a]|nr:MAG: hypothetical protein VR72_01090 [Clostridiaceae bacterium BRH_c20a]
MKVFRSLEQYISPEKPVVAALGNFDGVHLGHKHLINAAKDIARGINGETLVFTFFPHPQLLFNNHIEVINSLKLKIDLLKSLGVENVLVIPFTKTIAELSPPCFVHEILSNKLKISHAVAGFNYTFGHKGKGKAEDLIKQSAEQNIKVTIIEPFYVEGKLVSSTKIRDYIKIGKIAEAARLLGYQPAIIGKVIEGNKIGRQMGFPTANLEWDNNLLIPATGVYAVRVEFDNVLYMGVLNIGKKPTVTQNITITMEVNILDFQREIYGCEIKIIFYKKLRDETKFASIIELKKQISNDVQTTIKYFRDTNPSTP